MKAHFNIHGVHLCICCDHPGLLETLSADLEHFRVRTPPRDETRAIRMELSALPASAGGPFPKPLSPYRLFIHKNHQNGQTVTRFMTSEMVAVLDAARPVIRAGAVPDASLLPDPAHHFLFTQTVGPWFKRSGLFFLHAGCVAWGQKGILLIGPTRAGKTTLSLLAVRAGFRFLSDEQPLLGLRNNRIWAYAFPRRIRLRPSLAAAIPELRRAALERLPGRKDLIFRAESIWKNCLGTRCRPRALVFPRFRKRSGIRLRRLAAPDVLHHLLQDDHYVWYHEPPWNEVSHRHLDLFRRLSETVPAYGMQYGRSDLTSVPKRLRALLG